MTHPASYPNALMAAVVGLSEPLPMADDRAVAANRTLPREEIQRDHPGSMLSSISGNAIKRINGRSEGLSPVLSARIALAASLHPPGELIVERKRNDRFCGSAAIPSTRLAGIKRLGASYPIVLGRHDAADNRCHTGTSFSLSLASRSLR
jgi:hypothetical protein